jgi:hypothetical protein
MGAGRLRIARQLLHGLLPAQKQSNESKNAK